MSTYLNAVALVLGWIWIIWTCLSAVWYFALPNEPFSRPAGITRLTLFAFGIVLLRRDLHPDVYMRLCNQGYRLRHITGRLCFGFSQADWYINLSKRNKKAVP